MCERIKLGLCALCPPRYPVCYRVTAIQTRTSQDGSQRAYLLHLADGSAAILRVPVQFSDVPKVGEHCPVYAPGLDRYGSARSAERVLDADGWELC